MKIYVAASYPRKSDAKWLANELKKAGHSITAGWIYEDEGYNSDERRETQKEQLERMIPRAVRDVIDVAMCEMLVCFTDGENQLTHGGRHSELGLALALHKMIVIIGPREQVFHYHPAVGVFETAADFIYEFAPELMA